MNRKVLGWTTLVVFLLVQNVQSDDYATVNLVDSASAAVGTLQLNQSSPSWVLIQIALTTTFDNTHTLVVTEAVNEACTTSGVLYNPRAIADDSGCAPTPDLSNCSLGSLSARHPTLDLGQASSTLNDTLATLSGLLSLKGRGIEIRTSSGLPVACGAILPDATCDLTRQIIVSTRNSVNNTVCADVVPCSRFSEAQVTPATNVTQPVCQELTADDNIRLSFQGVTKRDFLLAEEAFRTSFASLHGFNESAIRVSRRAIRQVNGSEILDITYGVVNNTLPAQSIIAQSILLQQLNDKLNETAASCNLRTDPCDCTLDGTGNSVATGLVGCFNVTATSYCVINGDGTGCTPAAVDGNTIDPVRFPTSGPQLVACPGFLPQTCLDLLFNARVVEFIRAPPPVEAEIDIPEPPTTAEEVEDSSYAAQGMRAVANGARTFLDMIQPETLPYAAINYQIQYERENGEYDMSQAQSDAQDWFMPFAVVAAIGILLFIFVPIYLTCVCCCRCCSCCRACACLCCKHRCGAEYDLPDDEELLEAEAKNEYIIYASRKGQVMYGLILLCFALIMLSFASIIIVANDSITEGVSDVGESSVASLDNVVKFVNQTSDQLRTIPTAVFDALLASILPLLDNLNADVSLQVQDLTRSGSTNIVDTLRNLSAGVDVNLQLATDIEARRGTLISQTNDYVNSANQLNTDTGTAQSNCIALRNSQTDPSTQRNEVNAICAQIIAGPSVSAPFDASAVPSLADVVTDLQDIQSNNFSGAAADGQARFENIPFETDEKATQAINDVTTELNNFQADMQEAVDDLVDEMDTAEADLGINDTKADVLELFDTDDESTILGMSTRYRTQFSQLVAGVFITFAALTALVVVLSMCCFDSVTHPADRSRSSDCGGRTLLGVAGSAGIFVTFLNLLLAILFLIFGLTSKVCQGIDDDGILQQVVDQPANWDMKYPLADVILSNPQVPLTVVGLLNSCRNGSGIWMALQIDNAGANSSLPDMDELANVTSELNITSELGEINLGDFEIIDDQTRQDLLDYQSLNLSSSFNVTDFNQTLQFLDTTPYVTTITSARDDLNTWITAYGPSPDANALLTELNNLLTDAANLSTQASAIETSQTEQIDDTVELTRNFESLGDSIQAFLDGVDAFNADFNRVSAEILDFASVEGDILEVVDKFSADVQRIVRGDIGRCQLFTTSYDAVVDSVCNSTHRGIDAWWFSMAMTSFCALVIMLLNIKYAGYLRRQGKNPLADIQAKNSRRARRKSRNSVDDSNAMPMRQLDSGSTATIVVDLDNVQGGYHGQGYQGNQGYGSDPPPYRSAPSYNQQKRGYGYGDAEYDSDVDDDGFYNDADPAGYHDTRL
eukprot:TRINITY_DN12146_c0_g3_i1.p1 TRINITY_DN12146_c0_g3~~TRINITY_DN12146_c0_g3_i1.p1  ORF type:complete len:1355 (+),score=398.68 TRINITY_DN12146_c0_g3_i1:133-4197(+)